MIKIITKSENKISFITDIPTSLANALRRSVLEIPILAIDEVEITKNDSALYDEIIAHRLGLIPLKNEKLNESEDCSCKGKGCSKCTYTLRLQIKGPCTVYSDDLKPKTNMIYKMPITLLEEGQELGLVANARLGKGINHSKYSSGLIFYRNIADIKIKDNSNKKLVEICPQKVFSLSNEKIKIDDINKCDLCMVCVEECGKEVIEVNPTNGLVFFIESWGQISAKEIFTKAIAVLNKNLKELSKKIK